MLAEVPLGEGENRQVLKLSASAMVRIERANDAGIDKALAGLQPDTDGFSVGRFVGLFAELLNAGKGASEEEALDLIDAVGFAPAVAAFEEACEAAFPQEAPGKPTPQGKRKPARK
ncbi:hypothetical protein KUV64_22010 [Mameliella alba]|uniref:hypothetical protein n=1 Tax=Mameliella alba TaxID=561184 RepID=UPI001C9476CD|nr:hypothetical protein [Mameliella alba]MBY6121813.1 hypothetical protein [Mameliella alba]